jgi:hypothetical protein
MDLILLPELLTICRLPKDEPLPRWALAGDFYAVCRNEDELSIVCPQSQPPAGIEADRDWRALKVRGPLGLSETGVIAALSTPLAAAGVPLFVISTFETDYLLVKAVDLSRAVAALRHEHTVQT